MWEYWSPATLRTLKLLLRVPQVLDKIKQFAELRCEVVRITDSALALHCCKAHGKINRKIENSTHCQIVTHEDYNLKLGTRDYVADITNHATLGSNRPSGGFPPNRGNITPV